MPEFKPETYGAAGNGTTDDSAAFTAMNAAITTAGGGFVTLEKTYFLPNGWTLPTGNLVVDGKGRGKIKANVSTSAMNAIKALSKTSLVLRDFFIEVPLTNLRTAGMAMQLELCTDVTVENVRTSGGVAGMWFVTCQRVDVRGCYVYKPKADGIHFGHGSRYCKAVGNLVVEAGDDSYAATYYEGFGVSEHIVFADNIAVGGVWGCGVAVHGASHVEITGNSLFNSALAGIGVSYHQDKPYSDNIKIVGNRISGAGMATKQPEAYWWGGNPANDPPVTAPSYTCGISIAAGLAIDVSDNTIENLNIAGRDGLYVTKARHLHVHNNDFRGIVRNGIHYAGSGELAYSLFTDNVFDTVTGAPVKLVGTGYTGPVTVAGNKSQNVAHVSPFAQVELTGLGATRAVVAGNINAEGRGVVASGSNIVNSGNIF